MAVKRVAAVIDLREEDIVGALPAGGVAAGTRLEWAGGLYEVVDVVEVVPEYYQLVLRPLDRRGLPISVSSDDLKRSGRSH
jgi:hypothetical protein